MIEKWINHPMRTEGRKDLDMWNSFWKDIYQKVQKFPEKFKEVYVPEGTLLYRAHTGGGIEPKLEHYKGYCENQKKMFEKDHRFWREQKDITKIRWENDWASFTSDPDIIGSSYFLSKGLQGFVIVICSKEAIDISNYRVGGFNEKEIVAPMDISTCVEILNFDDFMKKYGTGNSDYEKRGGKQMLRYTEE